jgi:hypothetical protein
MYDYSDKQQQQKPERYGKCNLAYDNDSRFFLNAVINTLDGLAPMA